MVVAGCGHNATTNTFELDIVINAPNATAATIDGTSVAPVGGTLSRGFPTGTDTTAVTGQLQTLAADGTVRASADYQFGTYCAAITPLLRQRENFIEVEDDMGVPSIVLDSIECERTDGTGTLVSP
jgi:hypothetical protein